MNNAHWQQTRSDCLARAAQLYEYYLEAESFAAKFEINFQYKTVLAYGAVNFQLNSGHVKTYHAANYGKSRN